MEIVYYSDNKEYAFFNGIKYTKVEKGYYRATLKQNAKNTNISRLHRAVWSYYNGDIPDGYDVHHKDENKENNNIDNLFLVEHGVHSLNHLGISLGKTWRGRPIKKYTCVQCGNVFQTVHCYGKDQNAYCSVSCGDKYRYMQKTNFNAEKTCPHCNKKFIPVKSDQVYCCNNCGQVERTKRYRAKKKLQTK